MGLRSTANHSLESMGMHIHKAGQQRFSSEFNNTGVGGNRRRTFGFIRSRHTNDSSQRIDQQSGSGMHAACNEEAVGLEKSRHVSAEPHSDNVPDSPQ